MPAYRQICRIETAFSLLHDLNFVCELDKRSEAEKSRRMRRFLEDLAANDQIPTASGIRAFLDDVDGIERQEFELVPFWMASASIDKVRNRAVARALELECDLLLMVDSDVFVPGGCGSALASLLGTMSHTGAAVVGGVYACRGKRQMAVEPAHPNKIYEADEVATGLMLIDLAQIAKVPRPLFLTVLSEDGMSHRESEDVYFCRKVRQYGLKVVADYTITTGHGTEDALVSLPAKFEQELKDKAHAGATESAA